MGSLLYDGEKSEMGAIYRDDDDVISLGGQATLLHDKAFGKGKEMTHLDNEHSRSL